MSSVSLLKQTDESQTEVAEPAVKESPKQKTKTVAMPKRIYDMQLIWLTLLLMLVGLTMVTSASVPVGIRLFNEPFHFVIRHLFFLFCAIILMIFVLSQPISRLYQHAATLMLIAIILLIVVLFLGSTVNGAKRWIHLGLFNLQPAEIAKLSFFIFLSSYLVRRNMEVRERFTGFIKPILVFSFIALLLLLQPDFGTVIVMLVTTIGMLFIAGAKVWQFIMLIFSGATVVTLLIQAEPYRLKRITAFLHPWDDPFGIGYQIIQSLMAYGRGHVFGQGLGNSIQKLGYLPEAHTDFVFSILAEEFGFLGVTIVLLLLFTLVFKALFIGGKCLQQKMLFEGYLACGFGIWFAFQIFVNVGATEGILPTKGLTLPLISYGGSSLFIMSVAVAILIRIDYERRVAQIKNQHLPQSSWSKTQDQPLDLEDDTLLEEYIK